MEWDPARRSHNRLLKDIKKASDRREKQLQDGRLSLPSGAGMLAIIASNAPDFRSKLSPEQQMKAFMEEAEMLQAERTFQHQQVKIRRRAVVQDLRLDFADPEVTDIILTGHGSISALWAAGGKNFDWRIVSKATSYLKQGRIEQRMCGNFPSEKIQIDGETKETLPHKYSVPLGTFAVSRLSNVIAAPGMHIPDEYPPSDLFRPVFNDEVGAPEQIQALNERYGNLPTFDASKLTTAAGQQAV